LPAPLSFWQAWQQQRPLMIGSPSIRNRTWPQRHPPVITILTLSSLRIRKSPYYRDLPNASVDDTSGT